MKDSLINNIETFTVDQKFVSGRLDHFFCSLGLSYSRTYIQRLIKNGNVLVNREVVTAPKTTVCSNDKIEVHWPEEEKFQTPEAGKFEFEILFEDDDVLVINKPPGVVVHPASGNWSGTVVNALIGRDKDFAERFDEINDLAAAHRPGIVHRLDKDTSGCLVIAKNSKSKYKLSESFAARKVEKVYSAIVYGHPVYNHLKIETLIGRHPVKRQKMSVVLKNGKGAVTIYDLEKKGYVSEVPVSLLRVKILTGRTHQIRVHLAYKKLPIVGDNVYGGRQKLMVERQMLHAGHIEFPHPVTGTEISLTCPYPEDFSLLLDKAFTG